MNMHVGEFFSYEERELLNKYGRNYDYHDLGDFYKNEAGRTSELARQFSMSGSQIMAKFAKSASGEDLRKFLEYLEKYKKERIKIEKSFVYDFEELKKIFDDEKIGPAFIFRLHSIYYSISVKKLYALAAKAYVNFTSLDAGKANDDKTALALNSLADMYEAGVLEGGKNFARAFAIRSNALKNFGESPALLFGLALMYDKGRGTKQSSVKAYYLAQWALRNEGRLSHEKLEKIKNFVCEARKKIKGEPTIPFGFPQLWKRVDVKFGCG